MHLDLYVTLAGLVVGFVVGMTGMGGGALMTPVLVLLFNVQPLAAVSSDLVASMIMKPVGGLVHLRRGTVHKQLVRWLILGSVPSAFCGVLLIKALGDGDRVQDIVKVSLGVALLLAVAMMIVRALLDVRQRSRGTSGGHTPTVRVRPVPTLVVGILGGLVVGMTSVGSGSLIIVALLMLYPALKAGDLVGTDLVQAVPLVASAALGHLLFGDFELGLTASILIGSLPGVYIGARLSSSAPSWFVRRAIAVVLLASALKLLDVPTTVVGVVLIAVVLAGPFVWARVRTRVDAHVRRTNPTAATESASGLPASEPSPSPTGR